MTAELFCDVDDFCKISVPVWERRLLVGNSIRRKRKYTMSPSEAVTILILFHSSSSGNFKYFYLNFVPMAFGKEFPNRAGCNRFVELGNLTVIPLFACLESKKATSRGIAFVDSTTLRVCCNARTDRHKTFSGIAERGKNSVGWFYGFKLHIIINDRGELVSSTTGKGNIDDRKGLLKIIELTEGKILGDKGYISKSLKEILLGKGIKLIARVKKNMKKVLLEEFDKTVLRKRAIIEIADDQLKNISQIEHSRHRNVSGFVVNTLCAPVSYSWKPKKPSLNLKEIEKFVEIDEIGKCLLLDDVDEGYVIDIN